MRPTDRTLTSGDHPEVRYANSIFVLLISIAAGADPVNGQSAGPKAARAVLAAPTMRVDARADSRLWLEGSSNVRDWTCKATAMEARFDVDSGVSRREPVESRAVRGVTVKVPVRLLKCGDRHMEAEMYKALKAPKLPAESFITAAFERLPGTAYGSGTAEIEGRLTIAGVERTLKMMVVSERLPDGTHRARGTVPILMTDFGITPPRPWGGILKTKDKVLIQFEIFVGPQS